MGEWKALEKASGTGWKELLREAGAGWKALMWHLFFDDFESGTVDKWADNGNGSISADDAVKHNGSYSMFFFPTSSYFDAYVTFDNSTKVKLDFWAYANIINILNYWRIQEGATVLVEVIFRENGQIAYRNGASLVDCFTYTNRTWYHIEIEADCSDDKYDLWIDGVKKTPAGKASFINAGTNFNKFLLKGKVIDPAHYDDIHIGEI
jgi:hypothetical protein